MIFVNEQINGFEEWRAGTQHLQVKIHDHQSPKITVGDRYYYQQIKGETSEEIKRQNKLNQSHILRHGFYENENSDGDKIVFKAFFLSRTTFFLIVSNNQVSSHLIPVLWMKNHSQSSTSKSTSTFMSSQKCFVNGMQLK